MERDGGSQANEIKSQIPTDGNYEEGANHTRVNPNLDITIRQDRIPNYREPGFSCWINLSGPLYRETSIPQYPLLFNLSPGESQKGNGTN